MGFNVRAAAGFLWQGFDPNSGYAPMAVSHLFLCAVVPLYCYDDSAAAGRNPRSAYKTTQPS